MARARGAKSRLGRYYRDMGGTCSWRVLHDPLDMGGFGKDAMFGYYEVAKMLWFNAFTPGTILLRRTQRNHNSRARFTVMEGEECQWLKGSKYNIHVEDGDRLVTK